MPNLFEQIPADLPEEYFEILASSDHIRIERIVSHGHTSPPDFWYDQDSSEFILLLQGQATLTFPDKTIELKPGDHLTIPAHQKHRVDYTVPNQDTVWLAVHF